MEDNRRFKLEVLAVAAALFMGALYIMYPFLDAVIFAIAASYLLRYSHEWISNQINSEFLSSAVIVTGVLGTVAIGVYTFVNNFGQILSAISVVRGSLETAAISVSNLIGLSESFQQQLVQFIGTLSNMLRERAVSAFASIPSVMIHLGVFSIFSIYLYRDGQKIERKVSEIVDNLPEDESRIARSLIQSMDYVFRGVFVTQFVVAFLMAVTAGLGFYLISMVTSPMPLIPLWALLIGLTALLPIVANFMVYGPVGLFYIISGDPVKGSLVLGFGLTVLQMLPQFVLIPYVGSRQMDEHPLIIFTGFLAGPLTLGIKGFILGPVILILTKEFVLDSTELFS